MLVLKYLNIFLSSGITLKITKKGDGDRNSNFRKIIEMPAKGFLSLDEKKNLGTCREKNRLPYGLLVVPKSYL